VTDEIKALREELANLRERIAVLEARPVVPYHMLQIGPGHLSPVYQPPNWVNVQPYVLPTITCTSDGNQK
jgi:hypothetical protein